MSTVCYFLIASLSVMEWSADIGRAVRVMRHRTRVAIGYSRPAVSPGMLAEVPPVPTRSKAPIASEMPAMAMASASRFLENLISALVGCLLGSMGGVIWGLANCDR